jgi:amino acid transporter
MNQQPMIPFLNQNANGPKLGVNEAAWMVTVSAIYLVFMLLVGVFFYKILVINKKCQIPWYGFAVFLMVLVVILGLVGISGLIMSSVQLSASLNMAEQQKSRRS